MLTTWLLYIGKNLRFHYNPWVKSAVITWKVFSFGIQFFVFLCKQRTRDVWRVTTSWRINNLFCSWFVLSINYFEYHLFVLFEPPFCLPLILTSNGVSSWVFFSIMSNLFKFLHSFSGIWWLIMVESFTYGVSGEYLTRTWITNMRFRKSHFSFKFLRTWISMRKYVFYLLANIETYLLCNLLCMSSTDKPLFQS